MKGRLSSQGRETRWWWRLESVELCYWFIGGERRSARVRQQTKARSSVDDRRYQDYQDYQDYLDDYLLVFRTIKLTSSVCESVYEGAPVVRQKRWGCIYFCESQKDTLFYFIFMKGCVWWLKVPVVCVCVDVGG